MKKLTKLQRHTAYLIMLVDIENGGYMKHCGFCSMFRYNYDIHVYGDKKFKKYFPELFRKKPSGVKKNAYWFDTNSEMSWQKRKKLIKQCIKETRPKRHGKNI